MWLAVSTPWQRGCDREERRSAGMKRVACPDGRSGSGRLVRSGRWNMGRSRKTGKVTVRIPWWISIRPRSRRWKSSARSRSTAGQWQSLRRNARVVPKRFSTVLPTTYRDCTCDMYNYCIALNAAQIAVLALTMRCCRPSRFRGNWANRRSRWIAGDSAMWKARRSRSRLYWLRLPGGRNGAWNPGWNPQRPHGTSTSAQRRSTRAALRRSVHASRRYGKLPAKPGGVRLWTMTSCRRIRTQGPAQDRRLGPGWTTP